MTAIINVYHKHQSGQIIHILHLQVPEAVTLIHCSLLEDVQEAGHQIPDKQNQCGKGHDGRDPGTEFN